MNNNDIPDQERLKLKAEENKLNKLEVLAERLLSKAETIHHLKKRYGNRIMTQYEQDEDDKLLEAEFDEYESCVVVDRERLRELFLNDKAKKIQRIEKIKSSLEKQNELEHVEEGKAEMNEKWPLLTILAFLIALALIT